MNHQEQTVREEQRTERGQKKFAYYRHNIPYDYPERSDEHMITVKKIRETHFDENYEYLEKGAWFWIKRAVLLAGLYVIVFPLLSLTHGLRIYGRKNLRMHKEELKEGAITVSNHVFMWDYLCVLRAIRPHMPAFPAWKTNFEGSNGPLIRWVGGVPIPDDSVRAMMKFQRAMNEVLESRRWLHVYPEGSLWFYYPDIRPLKKAVFQYAVKFDRPVVPITMSFRERRGIWKLLGRKPLVDLHVGEPLSPDKSLPRREAEEKLQRETYHIMQVMNGIYPGDPTYNEDQNIQRYKKTM